MENKNQDRDLLALREFSSRLDLGRIEKAVDSVMPSQEKLARQIKLHLCHRYSGMKLREIGKRFGIKESDVTQASRRIEIRRGEDKKLRKIVKTIEAKLFL